ncbi:MAG: hypothetical protein ABIH76_04650 [Candidatus Bathyarchaeota archaeon]
METTRKPIVYVVNQGGHDVDKAKAFGELVILTQDKVNVFATDRVIAEMTVKLKDFDATKDFILLSGAIILNVIAMKLIEPGLSGIRVLLYNFHLDRYIVRNI